MINELYKTQDDWTFVSLNSKQQQGTQCTITNIMQIYCIRSAYFLQITNNINYLQIQDYLLLRNTDIVRDYLK